MRDTSSNKSFSYFLRIWQRTSPREDLGKETAEGLVMSMITLAEGITVADCLFPWDYNGYELLRQRLIKKLNLLMEQASQKEIAKLELDCHIWQKIYEYASPGSKLEAISFEKKNKPNYVM